MCQPSRWWWGLAPLAALWIVASAVVTPLIESEITHRAVTSLAPKGGQPLPVSLAIEGRDVVIEGVAASNDRLRAILLAALEVDGVRLVVNNTRPENQPSAFRWSATRDAKSITLSGQVANDGARAEIVAVAKQAMPGLAVDDQMTDAAVAAERRQMASIALAQLAKLRAGSVTLSDNAISIAGTTADEASAVALTVAASQLPQPLQLGSVDVRGPTSRSTSAARTTLQASLAVTAQAPYVWSAVKDGDGIKLMGSTPSDGARTRLAAAAKTVAGKGRVTDKMRVAVKPDQGFEIEPAATFAVGHLVHLRTGSVKISDAKLIIEGEANDAAAFQALTAVVAGTLPGALKLERMSIVPPRVSNYKWSAHRSGKTLTLSGNYPDEATRQAMLMAVNQRFAGFALQDRTVIASGAPAGFAPAMGMGLDQLARLESGGASIAAGRFTLSGVAASATIAADARTALTKLVGGMPAEARVTVAAAVLPLASISPPLPVAPPLPASPPAAAHAASPATAAASPSNTAASASPLQPAQANGPASLAAACSTELESATKALKIEFGSSRADVLPASRKVIQQIAGTMKRCPAMTIEIAGHTDSTGPDGLNETLSKARAEVIVVLLTKSGIEATRLKAIGYGSSRPVTGNVTPAGKARNRRIEFIAG